jgi:hypothetical protein
VDIAIVTVTTARATPTFADVDFVTSKAGILFIDNIISACCVDDHGKTLSSSNLTHIISNPQMRKSRLMLPG